MKVPGCKMARHQEILCSNHRNKYFFLQNLLLQNHLGAVVGSVVNNTLDYQSRDPKNDPLFLRSLG